MELEIICRVDLSELESTLAATKGKQELTKIWEQLQPIFEQFLNQLEHKTGYKVGIRETCFMGVEWEARAENCYEAILVVELTAPDYVDKNGNYSVYEVWDKDFDRKMGFSVNVQEPIQYFDFREFHKATEHILSDTYICFRWDELQVRHNWKKPGFPWFYNHTHTELCGNINIFNYFF